MGFIDIAKKKLVTGKVALYREEITNRNYNSFYAYSLVGTIISALVMLYGFLMHKIVTFNSEFFIIFCYFAVLLLSSKIVRKRKQYVTVAFYLAISPLMAMGILMGTFLDPEQPSITIMVFLCVLTIFILDEPWRIILYISAVAIIYSICCFYAKSGELFSEDMVDLIAFYLLGIGVNCFALNDRIDSVENFIKFRIKSEIDPLTDIYNRGAGVEKIDELLRYKAFGAFMIIDIDNFKTINDTYGHAGGDQVLRSTAQAIREVFDEKDILMRMGGDEFIVYVPGLITNEQCTRKTNKLFEQIAASKKRSIVDCSYTISLGCAIYNRKKQSFHQLYQESDECLYKAKRQGKSCCVIKIAGDLI